MSIQPRYMVSDGGFSRAINGGDWGFGGAVIELPTSRLANARNAFLEPPADNSFNTMMAAQNFDSSGRDPSIDARYGEINQSLAGYWGTPVALAAQEMQPQQPTMQATTAAYGAARPTNPYATPASAFGFNVAETPLPDTGLVQTSSLASAFNQPTRVEQYLQAQQTPPARRDFTA